MSAAGKSTVAQLLAGIASRPLHVVVLAPSVEAVAAREAGRPHTAYGPGNHTLAALDHALRQETPRLGLWLDTSTLTAAQTVDEIVRRADEALVA